MMRLQNSKVAGRLSTSVRWLVILMLAMPVSIVWSAPAAPTAEIAVNTTADELNGAGVMLTNSTLSGNRAYGDVGGINSGGEVTLTHVTITDNTAGVDNNGSGNGGGFNTYLGTFTMVNTIVAGNIDKGDENPDCRGDFTSEDYNLLGISDSPYCTFTEQDHDLVGTGAVPLEPYLEDALADNGGPTLTHALKPTGPAVDWVPAGVNGCVFGTRDQRGVVRVPACDIGAYEIDRAVYLYLPVVLRN